MKKPLKIILIVVAVLLVFIAAASLLVRSYLNEDRIRDMVLEISEKNLGRTAALGSVDISLFRGIVVRDFEIREKDAESVFFKTKEFVLAYQFFPLLRKKLIIDKLSVADVELSIRANADGTYNFSDMIKKGKPEIPEEEVDEKAAGLPLNLNVRNIAVKNAKIGYTDAAGKLKKADVIVNADLKVTGISQNALSSEGTVDVAIAEVLLKEGNKAFKDIAVTGRYNIDLDMAAGQVSVHSVDLDVMKIPVSITGSVNYAPGTAYALNVKMPDFNLSSLRPDLAAAFLPPGMTLGGNMSANVDLDKKPDDTPLRFDGSLKMNKLSCKFKNMNLTLDGSVRLKPEIISLEGLKLIAGQNQADISGTVRNYQKYPDINVAVKSKHISLDELIVSAPDGAKKVATDDKAAKEPEPMNLKLALNASLDIDKTVYKNVAITDFRSRYTLKNNVFTVPSLKGKTLSGAFAFNGGVDLVQRGMRYNMNADLSGVKIDDVLNAFAPKVKGKLVGTLSGKAAISGAGTLPANLKRNLKGNGEFAIHDGALKNNEVSAGLLAILGLQDMKEIPMDKANGNFTIANEIVNLKTVISSKDISIDETGTIGLNERLDLGIMVKVSDRLAPKLVSQSSIAQFLSTEQGWTSLPLRVGGTISKPSYGVDMRVVGKKVGEKVQQKVGEELRKILQRDQTQTTGTGEPKSVTPADRLKDLFGR
ncbi:MAG: AsmA family protein [Smithella sp.]|nr:AsmA family protein [Smithella sp.]